MSGDGSYFLQVEENGRDAAREETETAAPNSSGTPLLLTHETRRQKEETTGAPHLLSPQRSICLPTKSCGQPRSVTPDAQRGQLDIYLIQLPIVPSILDPLDYLCLVTRAPSQRIQDPTAQPRMRIMRGMEIDVRYFLGGVNEIARCLWLGPHVRLLRFLGSPLVPCSRFRLTANVHKISRNPDLVQNSS